MKNLVPASFRGCVLVRRDGEELLRICQGMREPETGLEITAVSNFGDDVWALQRAILETMT